MSQTRVHVSRAVYFFVNVEERALGLPVVELSVSGWYLERFLLHPSFSMSFLAPRTLHIFSRRVFYSRGRRTFHSLSFMGCLVHFGVVGGHCRLNTWFLRASKISRNKRETNFAKKLSPKMRRCLERLLS